MRTRVKKSGNAHTGKKGGAHTGKKWGNAHNVKRGVGEMRTLVKKGKMRTLIKMGEGGNENREKMRKCSHW
jgi:hypothetical protein